MCDNGGNGFQRDDGDYRSEVKEDGNTKVEESKPEYIIELIGSNSEALFQSVFDPELAHSWDFSLTLREVKGIRIRIVAQEGETQKA